MKISREIKGICKILPFFAIACACQSEVFEPQENNEPKRVIRVKATLPGPETSRTHITYGNTDIENEIFEWDNIAITGSRKNDFISVFNISKLSSCPADGIQLDVVEIDGRNAVFESTESVDPSFKIEAGDTIFVNYWDALIKQNTDLSYDARKIFTIIVGTEANKPQWLGPSPADSMMYMQSNLKMYDIVVATEDNKIPDLHFRHLSAIMRVTLRNETGKYIYPTKLEFKYPGTESFFNTTLYCSVDPDPANKSGLKVYDDDDFFTNSSKAYTDKIGTTMNGKIGTKDAGDSIAPGKTYDLYLSTVPRIGNTQTGDSIRIDLIKNHDTDHPYKITLKGFNKPIEAGKRYWFNLTAVEENDSNILMLTSDWLALHPDAPKVYE